jgi:hypothetical protein
MPTLREAIYTILETDAKLHTGTELGSLLDHYGTAPYGVFFSHPPPQPDLPLVTYSFTAQSQRFPRQSFLTITVWGNNFEAVHKRIYSLLNDALPITASDSSVKMIKWEWAGPELWDDDLKCYYQQQRYEIKGIVI